MVRNRLTTLSSSVTSAAMPVAPSLPATACKRSALRAAMITSAPCAFANSAVARPMPEDPPTTTIFWPASISRSLILRICGALNHATAAATNPHGFPRRILCPTLAQTPRQPSGVDAAEGERETEPGERVLQVIVGQRHHQSAGLGQAAGRRRRFELDVERPGRVPGLGRRNRFLIARVPDVVLRLVVGREH